ncbi:cell division protein CpoB [Thiomicrorhabdus hydrogeniphila]
MRKTLLLTAISGLSLTLALPVSAATTGNLEQRVNRLERMMDNPVLLQLSRRLGEQQRDIQSLQDENDRLKRELRNIHSIMDKRYKESDERLSHLEGSEPKTSGMVVPDVEPDLVQEDVAAPTPAVNTSLPVDKPKTVVNQNPTPVEANAAVTTESAEPTVIKTRPATDIEKEKYKQAFALMRASKYDESIQSFGDFIKQYPQSELASNAAYWSGEGYLIKGDNQKALDSFLMVIQRYPDSSKIPDATLRAGDSYRNLGNTKKAEMLYKQIINDRPTSRAAKNAQKRLEKS